MTIYQIKQKMHDTEPHFFNRETMKFFGQTMRDFRVRKQSDGRYLITAPTKHGETMRYFNPVNNELEIK
jgi:hypothetical protein